MLMTSSDVMLHFCSQNVFIVGKVTLAAIFAMFWLYK